MPARRHRSRSLRRVFVRTPGGRVVMHYEQRKPKLGRCPITGQTLKGVPRERPIKMQNMPKTFKRPQRPFGGVLSSQASREVLKSKARFDNLE